MDFSAYNTLFEQVSAQTGNRYSVPKLLLNIASAYEAHMLHSVKKLNVGFCEYSILLHLHFSELQNVRNSQNDLARAQKRDKALIARAIRRLSKLGYVSSQRDPENRTRKIVSLEEKGREILPQILEGMAAWEEEIVHPLEGDVGNFIKQLVDVHTRAESHFDRGLEG